MVCISVIIPAYNAEKTIKETIQSVLDQTFQDFEIIVINDGSQDRTLENLATIQDSRIQVYSYENSGQSISRNRGFQESKGEFISFLDADDLWIPDKLEAQLTALKESSNAAIAYSWTNYIDENSNIIRRGSQLNITGDVYPNLLIANFLENGSNLLIQRKAFMEVGEFDKDLTPAEDWDLYLRLAARYHFVVVPKAQILYRVYSNSMSSNTLKMEKSTLKVINRAFQQAPESLQYLKKQSLANLYKYLTFKALEQRLTQQTDVARFFKNAIQYDPSLLTKRVSLKILSQIAAKNFLSPAQIEKFSQRHPQFFNPVTLLGYMEIYPK